MPQPAEYLSALLDRSIEIGLRDDAAMHLADFDTPEVEATLHMIACDPDVDWIVRASCGESLAELWSRRGAINEQIFRTLTDVARQEATALLVAKGFSVER